MLKVCKYYDLDKSFFLMLVSNVKKYITWLTWTYLRSKRVRYSQENFQNMIKSIKYIKKIYKTIERKHKPFAYKITSLNSLTILKSFF